MKIINVILVVLFFMSFNSLNAEESAGKKNANYKTESLSAPASTDQSNSTVVTEPAGRNEIPVDLNEDSKSNIQKAEVKKPSRLTKFINSVMNSPSKGVLIVLAILIPFVAVGIKTDWGLPVLWNLLWCLLGFVPGIIHALIVVTRK